MLETAVVDVADAVMRPVKAGVSAHQPALAVSGCRTSGRGSATEVGVTSTANVAPAKTAARATVPRWREARRDRIVMTSLRQGLTNGVMSVRSGSGFGSGSATGG